MTWICLILMTLNVSLTCCTLTHPWRNINDVLLVLPSTGNRGPGMRLVVCLGFKTLRAQCLKLSGL